ncbi:MAG: hypothetical protein Q9160_001881 [Pyrenula sp. 1 TL-2023]
MCGRYALGIRAAFVRHQLEQQGLPVEDAPPDEEVRESFNFAPGYNGLVYRADVPDHGLRDGEAPQPEQPPQSSPCAQTETGEAPNSSPKEHGKDVKYHLKAMKWGLVPFWTKRSPDYGSMMRTINCRDDSLLENRGMWTSMKKYKRCIVVCQGFYEWLKKGPGGKEKVPHFVKRKDGQLMCFAGLWDCVKYENAEDALYTYSVITTDSNKQLKFLHDRMPVILDSGSQAMMSWLNPTSTAWTRELQILLKPYEGELECYPVIKDVGKVGNNSADFVIPIDSKENKNNIANFFANSKQSIKERQGEGDKNSDSGKPAGEEVKIVHETDERRITSDKKEGEDNAPIPVPAADKNSNIGVGHKRQHSAENMPSPKAPKVEPAPEKTTSPPLSKAKSGKGRSAISNGTVAKSESPKKTDNSSQRITSFFGKT